MSDPQRHRISMVEAYRGKHVLLTGGSGFLGKVWLSMVLMHLPEIGKIYVFMRPKALVSGTQRFQNMLNSSPAFKPLHDRHGEGLTAFLSNRLEVVEGNLEEEGLGFAPAVAERLRRDLDLVIHCAGLVDFNPELGKAIAGNVLSTQYVADFVEECEDASLLHISTSYIAGSRCGRVPERLVANYAPRGEGYNALAELEDAQEQVEQLRAQNQTAKVRADVEAEIDDMLAKRREGKASQRLRDNLVRRGLRERLKEAMCDAGMERARALGFPNTYTYSKSMAESVLEARSERIRFCILRPTIVESAVEFPFKGWNESFNGSAPLAYVMESWFRAVPAKPDAPFDVIPVDLIARSMTSSGAAVMLNCHSVVYQIGTSDRHRINVGRAAELITLAHRQYLRHRERSRAEQVLKSRWDSTLVHRDDLFGVEIMRGAMHGAREALDLLPPKLRRKVRRVENRINDIDGKLADIEHMVDLYMPFMYENFHVFECRAIDLLDVVEPEFRFAPEDMFEWRSYWLETHIPGLRRWAFPLIEGKRPERYRAPHRTTLAPPANAVVSDDSGVRVPPLEPVSAVGES